jgi:FkbM family methyltransferase
MKPYAYLGGYRGIMQLAHMRLIFDTRDIGMLNVLSQGPGGIYEPDVWTCLHDCVTPGSTFVDVGANVGVHACLGGALTRGTGRVLAFEANPRIVPMLQDNLKLNVDVPYRVVNAAVYDRKARMTFSVETEQHRVGALVIAGAENYGEERYEVDVVTLDDYADEIPAGRVVIKIDVEGREGGVLRGAQKVLSRPDVVLIAEYHRDVMTSTGDNVEQVFSELIKKGFAPHFLHLPPTAPEVTSVDRLLAFGGHTNLVWLRR